MLPCAALAVSLIQSRAMKRDPVQSDMSAAVPPSSASRAPSSAPSSLTDTAVAALEAAGEPLEWLYRVPRWLPTGHAQTIVPALFARLPVVKYRRERWTAPDGQNKVTPVVGFGQVQASAVGFEKSKPSLHNTSAPNIEIAKAKRERPLSCNGEDASSSIKRLLP